jgi:PLAT/LH2 domain
VECADLGNLTKIQIGHDGVGIGCGWFLDKVYVTNPLNSQQWVFLCGRWLDGKIAHELPVSEDGVSSQPCMHHK